VRRPDHAVAGLSSLDRWTLGYAGVSTMALLWRWPRGVGGYLAVAHALVAVIVLLAPRMRGAGRGAGDFLGEFYPLLLLVAFYTEVGLLNAAAGVSHDVQLQGWERALFACQPSLDWARRQPWPWLSGLLHLAYLSYYPLVGGVPLGLWIAGRRAASRRTLLLVMVTFYICYSLFLAFPVAGPRYAFPPASHGALGIGIAAFAHALVRAGSAWGTAFPSSHVAVAVVASACAWRESPRLGAATLLATVLLSLGTVYGQFHYALDAIAGAAVGAAVLIGASAADSAR
jgi:membrane-associated phospholipid phosphatase